jgi:hypothetical protein
MARKMKTPKQVIKYQKERYGDPSVNEKVKDINTLPKRVLKSLEGIFEPEEKRDTEKKDEKAKPSK